jgi:4-hydroxyacetophenone monooxygenase
MFSSQGLPGDEVRRGLVDGSALAALREANLPTLLSVLYQLTGDDDWLRPPFRPTRTRGLEDHDSGGFDEALQERIRAAMLTALQEWTDGKPIARPAPVGAELVEMMSANVGEPVAADFEPMMAEELGFRVRPQRQLSRPARSDFQVLVIGAGVSGLAMAVQLKAAGVPFVVLEKNDEVGGTWLENRYPGCGVDTPSYLYSYSFQETVWSSHFGKRDEVASYLAEVATDHDLRRFIEFGSEVTSAQWEAETGAWSVEIVDHDGVARSRSFALVITAVGQLNRPKVPEIAGAEDFGGVAFHSARWPAGFDVRGQRVAVVGAGASAMQIVPAVVDRVSELVVVQRSPQWIAPNDNYFKAVSPHVHWLLRAVPSYRDWYRFRLAWNFNDKIHATLKVDPSWPGETTINAANDAHRKHLTRYLEAQLADRPDLLRDAKPHYPPFGKRMLLDNGWYKALKRDHVRLVTTPISRLHPAGIETSDGCRYDVDVVIYATGFEAQRLLHPMDLRGDGLTIREAWGEDDPRAYLGMASPGFPNLFFLYGPNTNLGHGGSWITMAECQARYLTDLICSVVEEDLVSIECRTDTFGRYNADLDATHAQMVWAHPGMGNWYRNVAGRVVTNFPWRVVDYWRMTERASLDDYACGRRAAASAGRVTESRP